MAKVRVKVNIQTLVGKRIQQLTILSEAPRSNIGSKHRKVFVKCDCGKIFKTPLKFLLQGKKKCCNSCIQKIHGHSHTRLHNIWMNIQDRCRNPNSPVYKWYGGKGVDMCSEWKDNFMNFYQWSMNNNYNELLQLDRIIGDKGYSPDNCRWVTSKENNRNRKDTIYITYNHNRLPLAKVLEDIGLKDGTYRSRIKRGWSIEKTLNTPVNYK